MAAWSIGDAGARLTAGAHLTIGGMRLDHPQAGAVIIAIDIVVMYGRPPLRKEILKAVAWRSGAVMYPAFLTRSDDRWPRGVARIGFASIAARSSAR